MNVPKLLDFTVLKFHSNTLKWNYHMLRMFRARNGFESATINCGDCGPSGLRALLVVGCALCV